MHFLSMSQNPYAPPEAPVEPQLQADAADLFVAMQPTAQVRAAGVATILTGVACVFVALQFVLGAPSQVPIVLAIESGLCSIGVAFFGVARSLLAARAWASIAGIALCLAGGVTSAGVFLVSGALSTVTAGGASLVTLVLLATSLNDHRKMAEARAAMIRAERRA
jgi:hypothetical protein